MRKIGILGGSFNPIHNLHIELARAALSDYALDEVRFMPAKCPPHKEKLGGATLEDRINMINLAIEDEPRFVLDLYETKQTEQTYTWSTLTEFKEKNPDDEIYFIMGEDSADTFHLWVKPEIICQKAIILVGPRENPEEDNEFQKNFQDKLNALSTRFLGTFLPLSSPKTDISSTKIKKFLEKGISCPDFVPVSVLYYIRQQKLYGYV